MAANTLLSIIIPVYQVQDYLHQCLDSIISGCDKGIEVIIVDDGSTDNSPSICDEYAGRYDNIQVIHKQNEGLSIARNTGLGMASGQYVWFVDSDDFLLHGAIDEVLAHISKYPDVDVFSTMLTHYWPESETYKVSRFKRYNDVINGRAYLKEGLPQGASQRFILKREFLQINNLSFCPGILHEDALFGYIMLYKAKKVLTLEESLYAYRIRQESSIMSNVKVKNLEDLISIHKQLVNFCENDVAKSDRRWFRYRIFKVIVSVFRFSTKMHETSEYRKFRYDNIWYVRKEAFYICSSLKGLLWAIPVLIAPKYLLNKR